MNLRTRLLAIYYFEEIASLYEHEVKNLYKAQAFRKAIKALRFKKPLTDGMQKKYNEIRDTDDLKYYHKLIEISNIIKLPGFTLNNYNNKNLTEVQKLSLKHKKHILRSIPHRDLITDIGKKLNKVIGKFDITGSYRREKVEGIKDIDILYVLKKNENAKDISDKIKKKFKMYLATLNEGDKKFTFFIKVPARLINKYYNAPKYIEIVKPSTFNRSYYVIQVDIRYFTNEEYPFALLHFTGSATFNLSLRRKVKTLGYKLNEYGLYKDDKKIEDLKSEKDIFEYLKIPYKLPKDREVL